MSGGDILALCLGSFSLGMFTNLLLYFLIVRRGRGGNDRREWVEDEEPQNCETCKYESNSYLEKPCCVCSTDGDRWEPKQ
jgi:hypothetical protein